MAVEALELVAFDEPGNAHRAATDTARARGEPQGFQEFPATFFAIEFLKDFK